MDFLDILRERLSGMLAERSGLNDQFEAILAAAANEQRSDLTEAEAAEFAALQERRAALDADIAATEQRVNEIDASRRDAAAAAEKIQRFNIAPRSTSKDGVRGSDHTLDELLWATADQVRAGSLDNLGNVVQHLNARASVEQVEVRNADKQPVLAPRIVEFTEARQVAIRNFQQTVADMQVFGMLVDKRATTGEEGFQVAREHRAFKDRWQRVLRAMDTDTSNEGVDWIPTGIGSSLHERVRASGKVAPLFQRITLPTNPWKWPLEGADATAYRVAEPTGDTATKVGASTPGTGAATFDAEIFGGRVLFSKSLEADSALAILPYVQRKLVQAFVDAEERAILDGDADGTHQDSDTNSAGATDAAWAWDGLRKRALANSSASGGSALTVALLAARRADMDHYGLNPAEMAFIVPISSYYALVTDSNVITVDKFGPQATILNGQLGSLYGVPIIVSEHVRTNLNASGIHDAITTTKTYALAVNRMEWVMGQRTPLALETDDSIYRETYQRVVVGFMRQDFQNVNARGTSEDDTSIVYNVTP